VQVLILSAADNIKAMSEWFIRKSKAGFTSLLLVEFLQISPTARRRRTHQSSSKRFAWQEAAKQRLHARSG
jgi:hypothetical protein